MGEKTCHDHLWRSVLRRLFKLCYLIVFGFRQVFISKLANNCVKVLIHFPAKVQHVLLLIPSRIFRIVIASFSLLVGLSKTSVIAGFLLLLSRSVS